jgi:DNA helicase IV
MIIGDYMKFYGADSNEMKFELESNKDYFNSMFKGIDDNVLLDEEQRTAVLLDADNLLVIAGAGSGKTTTMVAKVVYLIEKLKYKESDIVVISFTRKVKEELINIIHDKFGYKGVNISTFHQLGLKIINASGENYKKIIDDEGQYSILNDYIKNVLFKDKESFSLFVNAFAKHLYFSDEWKSYDSFIEYHNEAYKNKMLKMNINIKDYNESEIKRRREFKKSIKGEYLRSKEEVDIANFLFKNGIHYEYEKRFDTDFYYTPDFYIKQLGKENYIEHFGVDENGYNGMYTKDELDSYLRTLKTKEAFFNESFNRGKFIVTFSKYDSDTTYLKEIKNELKNKGYVPLPLSEDEIYEQLKNTNQEGYTSRFIQKVLIPFISLYKQKGYNVSDFDELIDSQEGILKEQLIVMKKFFTYYHNVLTEKKYIDFEDMIYKGYNVIPSVKENNLGVDYKYLIIDEYQDISNSRFNLIKRMADLFDAKVMAVGDDWQTIFGYSGARVDLFKNFELEMEDAVSVPILNTYRNSQELIDIAGTFVLKNEDQIIKRLKSNKHMNNPVEIVYYDDDKKEEQEYNRAKTLEKILDHIVGQKTDSKVLLMGRYKKDIYKINNSEYFKVYLNKAKSKKYPDLQIDFLTVHQAKGTGYDYCVLLDLNDDIYGFPSKIEDLPIIKLIRPKIDEPIAYPEERRLFYVALTRTKNKVFLLAPKKKVSSFAMEIMKYENVRVSELN